MKVHYIQGFKVKPKQQYILTRLRYIKQKTAITSRERMQIDQWMDEALELLRPKGAYVSVKILRQGNDQIIFPYKEDVENLISPQQSVILKSKKLYDFLAGYERVLLLGATIGEKIITHTREEFAKNPSKSVVYDAVASQAADACLDEMVTLLEKVYSLKGYRLSTRRYSPGYGDLSLEVQKELAHFLALDRIGIQVTDSFMLEPEKSVIAIVGIK